MSSSRARSSTDFSKGTAEDSDVFVALIEVPVIGAVFLEATELEISKNSNELKPWISNRGIQR